MLGHLGLSSSSLVLALEACEVNEHLRNSSATRPEVPPIFNLAALAMQLSLLTRRSCLLG